MVNKDDKLQVTVIIESIIEITILAVAYFLVWKNCYRGVAGSAPFLGRGKIVLIGIYVLLLVVLLSYCDGFKFGDLHISDIFISQCVALLIIDFVTYFQLCLISNEMITCIPMLLLYLIDCIIALLCTALFTILYQKTHVPKKLLLIYGTENAISLQNKLTSRPDKYNVTKTISIEEGVENIFSIMDEFDAIVLNDVSANIRNDILKYCYGNEIRVYTTPKLSDIILSGADEVTLFDTPILLVKGKGLTAVQRFFKRSMDLLLGLLAFIPFAIVFVIVAAAIKIEDGGPIFYKQERITKDFKKFNILKFRSMIVNAEKDGKSIPAIDNDPRITKVGKVIRACRIDELPQILNIIRGDMSIVGPRPERTEHVEKFLKEIPEFSYRYKVKGGLTGYAQVFGKYNTTAYDKLRLDLMYIERYSFLLDLRIILMTIRILFKKESTEGFDKQQ